MVGLQQAQQWALKGFNQNELTLYIDNIPAHCKKRDMLSWLDSNGFRDTYDYFYLPRCFRTGQTKGYAFINFFVPEAIESFLAVAEVTDFGVGADLTVSLSTTQGLAANLAQWLRARSRRVRDPEVLPFVRSLSLPVEAGAKKAMTVPQCSEVPVPAWFGEPEQASSAAGSPRESRRSSNFSEAGSSVAGAAHWPRRGSSASEASSSATGGVPVVACRAPPAVKVAGQSSRSTIQLGGASVVVLQRFYV